MEHLQHLAAGRDGLADETMQPAYAKWHRPIPLQALDEACGAGEKAINDSLVVLHRRALRHDQRNDAGARGREAIDSERAVDDPR